MTVERKYAMTRLGAGDYLLPSNDARTVWRISRYEDGPSHGLEEWPRDMMVWGAWRYTGPGPAPSEPEHLNWGYWSMETGPCDTRAEAIQEALT